MSFESPVVSYKTGTTVVHSFASFAIYTKSRIIPLFRAPKHTLAGRSPSRGRMWKFIDQTPSGLPAFWPFAYQVEVDSENNSINQVRVSSIKKSTAKPFKTLGELSVQDQCEAAAQPISRVHHLTLVFPQKTRLRSFLLFLFSTHGPSPLRFFLYTYSADGTWTRIGSQARSCSPWNPR